MSDQKLQQLSIGVQGMTCANCSARVERALNKADGVSEASVNLATEKATVRFVPGAITLEAISDTIRRAGYEVLQIEEGQDSRDAERAAREEQLSSLRGSLLIAVNTEQF